MNIPSTFNSHFNGQRNPLTPYQESFGQVSRYADRTLIWELSKGNDMDGRDMWGVTVLEVNSIDNVTKHHHKLGKGGFSTEAAAREHIADLKTVDIGVLS